MKKLLFLLLPAAMLVACNNTKSDPDTAANDTTTTKQDIDLAYSVEKTPDWERGDDANVAIAMNALKAYEVNDMNALRQQLADSVEFYADKIGFKGSKDSLVNFLTDFRNSVDTIHIKMHDYESVKSKNRGEEWVALWYTETVTSKDGKVDSSMTMDDIKLVNGKITIIDSKLRHLVQQQK